MDSRSVFDPPADGFDRRRFLITALGAGIALTHAAPLFAAEFWNAKDPSAWTEDEVLMLVSKSPWARAAVPEVKGGDDPTEAGGAVAGGRSGGMERRRTPTVVTVRWESAQPILDALKAPLAADFAGHYVLSVTNLPGADFRSAGRGRGGRGADDAPDDALERLQNGATLQAKGKDAAEAGIARRTRIGSILFGFSRDYLHLAATDRDILFKLETGQMSIRAKFDAKEMIYHGKLAV